MAWIELDGAVNVRDLGDLPTENGHKTARSRLLRGDNLQGVPAQAVVADYAATGERTEAIVARLRRSPLYARDINSRPADLHRPRPETMTAFLEQLDARYGGVLPWLTDHYFSGEDLRMLRA